MADARLLLRYLGPFRQDLLVAAACLFCEKSIELFIPILTAALIDDGIMAGDLAQVWASGARMLACAAAAMAFGLMFARSSARAAMGLGANLRHAEYAAIQG